MLAGIGAWVERTPRAFEILDRLVNRGRRVRTDRLRGFVPLYVVAGLRRFRRRLLRHRVEVAHLEAWLAKVHRLAPADPALATEVLKTRRLIKGYSDTHARGLSKFDRVLSALPLLEGRPDGAAWLRRLREAALVDEEGTALDGALKTVAQLDAPVPAATAA
jgi:indolepyruvate ferredoxin oxidoreductase beta subunit